MRKKEQKLKIKWDYLIKMINMSEKITNDWKNFFWNVCIYIIYPFNRIRFILFFLCWPLILWGAWIWYSWYTLWDFFDKDVIVWFYTYFIALLWSTSLEIIYSNNDNEKSIIWFFLFVLGVMFFVVWISNYNIYLWLLGYVLSLSLWIISNSSNPNLIKKVESVSLLWWKI